MWNVLTYISSVNPWCKWLSLNDVGTAHLSRCFIRAHYFSLKHYTPHECEFKWLFTSGIQCFMLSGKESSINWDSASYDLATEVFTVMHHTQQCL